MGQTNENGESSVQPSIAIMTPAWILALSCTDRMGIVAGVTGALAEVDAFILDSQQYADLDSGRFFMRIVFAGAGSRFPVSAAELEDTIKPVADKFSLRFELRRADRRPKVLIAVSKGSHCLVDLLHRWRSGVLAIDPVGIVSNHPDLAPIASWYGVPYHYLPVSPAGRVAQERSLLELFRSQNAELLVLARYMQVLSGELAQALDGRCINIHHSFLPSFKGAQPYQRAHERGVKLIGATAHFVSAALDEGPIIEQAVVRVDHRATAGDLARIGRDIEAKALAKAVGWIAEQRVFLNGNRTVVFS